MKCIIEARCQWVKSTEKTYERGVNLKKNKLALKLIILNAQNKKLLTNM